MRTDGLFDYRHIRIQFSQFNKPISLYPISDIHYNSPNFARESWENFLNSVRKDKNDKYFLFLGDILDSLSSKERTAYLTAGFHDTTVLRWEEDVIRDCKNFIKEIGPLAKGRTLAVFSGNHFYRFKDGTTTDNYIARCLDATHIGVAGFVVISLAYRGLGYTQDYTIFCHHGTSDARMKQARANFRCDLLCMGHNHQMKVEPMPEIEIVRGGNGYKIRQHETKVVRCGSFLKSFEAGMSSYAVDALYSPAVIGCPRVEITPCRKEQRPNNVREEHRWIETRVTV